MLSFRSNHMCRLMTGTPTSFFMREKYSWLAHCSGTMRFTTSTAPDTVPEVAALALLNCYGSHCVQEEDVSAAD